MGHVTLDECADILERVRSAEREAMKSLCLITSPEDKESVRATLDDAGYDAIQVYSHPSVPRGEVRLRRVPQPEPLVHPEFAEPQRNIFETLFVGLLSRCGRR